MARKLLGIVLEATRPSQAPGYDLNALKAAMKRAFPKGRPPLTAADICSVQPMSGSTGLIFFMDSKYKPEVDNG